MSFDKYLDPKNDIAFRKIFGNDKHKDILINFLNAVLVGIPEIADVKFLKTIQDPDLMAKKQSIVDVLCMDEAGCQYIVEMQVARTRGFEQRAQYYAAKAYINQMNKGEAYEALKEVIFIAITDFVMFPNKKAYKSDHITVDKLTGERDLKAFSFTFIELPKFPIPKEDVDNASSLLEKWCYFFKYADEADPKALTSLLEVGTPLTEAYTLLERFNWNNEEFQIYEAELKRQRDEMSILSQARWEGFKKGQLALARKLLQQGLTLEQIAVAMEIDVNTLQQLLDRKE